jgi:hypothetical protein
VSQLEDIPISKLVERNRLVCSVPGHSQENSPSINTIFAEYLPAENAELANLAVTFNIPPGGLVLDKDHPVATSLKDNISTFNTERYILCPAVKPSGEGLVGREVSVIHEHGGGPVHQQFQNLLRNLRYFDKSKDGHNVKMPPFIVLGASPQLVFSDAWVYTFLHGFAAAQRMDVFVASLAGAGCYGSIFERRITKEDGTPGDEYIMSPKLFALVDFYIYSSPWSWSGIQGQYCSRNVYTELLAEYLFFDRNARLQNQPDSREILKMALVDYVRRFPDVLK